jgi:hypothetical protein
MKKYCGYCGCKTAQFSPSFMTRLNDVKKHVENLEKEIKEGSPSIKVHVQMLEQSMRTLMKMPEWAQYSSKKPEKPSFLNKFRR